MASNTLCQYWGGPRRTNGASWAVRVVLLTAAGLLIGWIGLEAMVWAGRPRVIADAWANGDYRLYMDAARRWLAGGSFYLAAQTSGPYSIDGAILYPPYILPFLAPFTVLPRLAWELPPLLITAYAIARLRPVLWARVGMLALLSNPFGWLLVVQGNPAIWTTAFLALATVGLPTGALVLFKPSLFPLALFGIRDRRWLIGVVPIVVFGLATLPMVPDYVRVLVNARGDRVSLLYSLNDLALVALPLVAWAGRTRSAGAWNGPRRSAAEGRLRA